MIEETIDVLLQHRINFHPMCFHLNSDHMAPYRELKNVAAFRNLTVEQRHPP